MRNGNSKSKLYLNKKTPKRKALSKRKLDNIHLDVGCGNNKQAGYVGMDQRQLAGVDIVHNIHDLPWPLPDMSCMTVLMSHVMEHLNPMVMISIFDEAWRVLKPNGQLIVATPHENSTGAYQDPTHTRPGFNQYTFWYFDPSKELYSVYTPKPFKIVQMDEVIGSHVNVIMETMKRLNGKPADLLKILMKPEPVPKRVLTRAGRRI